MPLGQTHFAERYPEGKVVWKVYEYIELELGDTNYTFTELDPGINESLAEHAVILFVRSNTSWSLSFEIKSDAGVIEHLSVLLGQKSGSGSADIPIIYKLSNLRTMAPGTYKVTVVYTVTTK